MKYTCKITEEIQNELNKDTKRNLIIMLIIGIVGMIGYIVVSMFVEHYLLEALLYIFAFLFVFAILLLVSIKKNTKKIVDQELIDEYEIFDDYLTAESYKKGEKFVSIKTYFKDIVKIKETENYLFLYPNKMSAYPVPKDKLSKEELESLKARVNSAMSKK